MNLGLFGLVASLALSLLPAAAIPAAPQVTPPAPADAHWWWQTAAGVSIVVQAACAVGLLTVTAALFRVNMRMLKNAEAELRLVHQQWMETTNWTARVEADTINAWFEVLNPTNMAVTLTGVHVEWMDGSGSSKDDPDEHVLPPKHTYTVSCPLVKVEPFEDYLKYHEKSIARSVVGKITFVDAFGQSRTQPFGCTCVLSKKQPATFRHFHGNLGTHRRPDEAKAWDE